jgi:hypothetical protein
MKKHCGICDSEETDVEECKLHVECDLKCGALKEPKTIEDYQKSLKHWEEHPCLSGCSHGC